MSLVHLPTFTVSFDVGMLLVIIVIIVRLGELCVSDTTRWRTNPFHTFMPQQQHDDAVVDVDIVASSHK